jgi:hypothetical protein
MIKSHIFPSLLPHSQSHKEVEERTPLETNSCNISISKFLTLNIMTVLVLKNYIIRVSFNFFTTCNIVAINISLFIDFISIDCL